MFRQAFCDERSICSVYHVTMSIYKYIISNNSGYRADLWKGVELHYNSVVDDDVYRTAVMLETAYKNILHISKKKSSQSKKNYNGTGGGEFQHCGLNAMDEEIMAQMGARGSGFQNNFDDNGITEGKSNFIMDCEL